MRYPLVTDACQNFLSVQFLNEILVLHLMTYYWEEFKSVVATKIRTHITLPEV
jgi:hypothetical protein